MKYTLIMEGTEGGMGYYTDNSDTIELDSTTLDGALEECIPLVTTFYRNGYDNVSFDANLYVHVKDLAGSSTFMQKVYALEREREQKRLEAQQLEDLKREENKINKEYQKYIKLKKKYEPGSET